MTQSKDPPPLTPEERPSAPDPALSETSTEHAAERTLAKSVATTEIDLSPRDKAPETTRPPRRASPKEALEAGNTVAPTTINLRRATLTQAGDSERPAAPAADAYLGYIIDGRYHIERHLAQGGMGVVYLARHRLIDKPVAIKILRPELVHDREITQRFLTEAQAASAIGSEHIVDITDYGELPDGATYIVMEYLEGQSLSERVRAEEPLAIEEVLSIGRQLAEALSSAHAAQIIHRDLKPDNVVLINRAREKGFVKILDFGIAKVASSQNQITRAGKIFGTPHYMSPEQARGEDLDRRTDIYSLGVMLYEMTSQHLPFEAENPLGVLTQHMYVEPKPLHEVCDREIPVGLEAVIAKCISKLPDERYSSMLELEEELARVAEGIEPLAVEELRRRDRTPQSLRTRIQGSGPSGSIGIVLGTVLAAGLAGVAWWMSMPPSDPLLDKPTAAATSALPTATQQKEDPASKLVALVLSPVDARVYRGRTDLGPMPINVRLRTGQKMELQVRRPGYTTHTFVLDGSEPRVVVQLQPLPGAPPPSLPPALSALAETTARTIRFDLDAGPAVLPAREPGPVLDAGSPKPKAQPPVEEPPTPRSTTPAEPEEEVEAESEPASAPPGPPPVSSP